MNYYACGNVFILNYPCQNLESEGLRHHLATFAESLSKTRIMIHPPVRGAPKSGETHSDLVETVEREHRRLLARKSIIEKRKEEQERQLLEMVYPFDNWKSGTDDDLQFTFIVII